MWLTVWWLKSHRCKKTPQTNNNKKQPHQYGNAQKCLAVTRDADFPLFSVFFFPLFLARFVLRRSVPRFPVPTPPPPPPPPPPQLFRLSKVYVNILYFLPISSFSFWTFCLFLCSFSVRRHAHVDFQLFSQKSGGIPVLRWWNNKGPYAPQGSTPLLPKLSVTSKVSARTSHAWVGSRVHFRSSEDVTLLEFTSPIDRE